jgi:hypothetical protein
MIKLILLIILFPYFLFAQFSYSCNQYELCTFNNQTSKFDNCKSFKTKTLIVMNSDLTMFTITSEEEKDAWYIKDYETNNGNGVFIYKAQSEYGGLASWMFALPQKQIGAMIEKEKQRYRIIYFIDNIF